MFLVHCYLSHYLMILEYLIVLVSSLRLTPHVYYFSMEKEELTIKEYMHGFLNY